MSLCTTIYKVRTVHQHKSVELVQLVRTSQNQRSIRTIKLHNCALKQLRQVSLCTNFVHNEENKKCRSKHEQDINFIFVKYYQTNVTYLINPRIESKTKRVLYIYIYIQGILYSQPRLKIRKKIYRCTIRISSQLRGTKIIFQLRNVYMFIMYFLSSN